MNLRQTYSISSSRRILKEGKKHEGWTNEKSYLQSTIDGASPVYGIRATWRGVLRSVVDAKKYK